MKNKIKNTKFWIIVWATLAIWGFSMSLYLSSKELKYWWILYCAFSLCMFVIHGVKLEILRNKEEKITFKSKDFEKINK